MDSRKTNFVLAIFEKVISTPRLPPTLLTGWDKIQYLLKTFLDGAVKQTSALPDLSI